jgi:hypothetical protein
VGAIGDDDDVVEVVFAGDGGEAVDLLLGIDGAGLGNDAAEGDTVGEEIVATDTSFGVAGVFVAAATEGNDERGDLFVVEIDGVIEASVQDRRRVAGVLGCTEDGDGVGGLGVVLVCDGGYLTVDPDTPCSGGEEKQQKELAKEVAAGRARSSQVGRGGDHLDGRTYLHKNKYGPRRVQHATGSIVCRASLQVRGRDAGGKILQTVWSRNHLVLERQGDLVSGDGAFAEDHPGVAAA